MPDWLLPCLLLLGLLVDELLPVPASAALLLAGVGAALAAPLLLRCASASKPSAAAAAAAVVAGVLHPPALAAAFAAGVEVRDAGLEQLPSGCLQGSHWQAQSGVKHCNHGDLDAPAGMLDYASILQAIVGCTRPAQVTFKKQINAAELTPACWWPDGMSLNPAELLMT
jgi:hypothetical protein